MRVIVARVLWSGAALLTIAYLGWMVVTGALPKTRQLIEFDAHGVLVMPPEQVREVTLRVGDNELCFWRDEGHWHFCDGAHLDDGAAASLERAVKFMYTATPVRVIPRGEIGPAGIPGAGLDDPRLTVSLSSGFSTLVEASFGELSADGFSQYMSVRGRGEVFLMSRFVGAEWATVAEATSSR